MPQGKPRSGERYLHFKNKLYQIITVAKHSETGEKLVIYQALYGDFAIYARPLSMFISEVDYEKYPQVAQKYRFMLVEENQNVGNPMQDEQSKTETDFVEKSDVLSDDILSQQEDILEEDTNSKQEKVNVQETSEGENISDKKDVMDLLMEFYDARTYEEKYKILTAMRDDITDGMINNMAVVLDVVISEGNLEQRYEELKRCIRTYEKYEIFR